MTNVIETTKRELYGCLDRIRRAGKHRVLTAEFEERLEEHLEALRQDGDWMRKQLATIRQANVDIQERLHAVDGAYFDQSKLVVSQAEEIRQLKTAAQIAGEELQRVQGISRRNLEDCRSAEKCSDDFSEKLRDAQSVIAHQEQLVIGQRLSIGEMHMVVRSAKSAVATLKRLGYTDCGGQLWKPPIGKTPEFAKPSCETCDGLGYVHCNGGRPTAPCPKGCQ